MNDDSRLDCSDMEKWDLDLGDDHRLRFHGWRPDRDLNPQFAHLPDVERFGAMIEHGDCRSAITFDGPVQRELEPNHPHWIVESLEPLTLSPSLLCKACGDHGFIRDGKWVKA